MVVPTSTCEMGLGPLALAIEESVSCQLPLQRYHGGRKKKLCVGMGRISLAQVIEYCSTYSVSLYSSTMGYIDHDPFTNRRDWNACTLGMLYPQSDFFWSVEHSPKTLMQAPSPNDKVLKQSSSRIEQDLNIPPLQTFGPQVACVARIGCIKDLSSGGLSGRQPFQLKREDETRDR